MRGSFPLVGRQSPVHLAGDRLEPIRGDWNSIGAEVVASVKARHGLKSTPETAAERWKLRHRDAGIRVETAW